MTKQEILVNKSGTISTEYLEDGQVKIPSSATVSIVYPDGTALPVAVTDAACTVDAAGEVTYTIAAENTTALYEGYVATFKMLFPLSTSPVTYRTEYQRLLFDVVISPLKPIVTFEDLVKRYPVLLKEAYHQNGTVVYSIAKNIVTDTSGNVGTEPTGFYAGWVFECTDGANVGWQSLVQSYSSGVFTLKKTAPSAWTAGDTYRLQNRYWNEIQSAWEMVIDAIRVKGKRPSLVMDNTELKEFHLVATLMIILFERGDLEKHTIYEKTYYDMLGSLRLRYDVDETGLPSDSTTAQVNVLRLRR